MIFLLTGVEIRGVCTENVSFPWVNLTPDLLYRRNFLVCPSPENGEGRFFLGGEGASFNPDLRFLQPKTRFLHLKRRFLDLKTRFLHLKRRFLDLKTRFLHLKRRYLDLKTRFLHLKRRSKGIDSRESNSKKESHLSAGLFSNFDYQNYF